MIILRLQQLSCVLAMLFSISTLMAAPADQSEPADWDPLVLLPIAFDAHGRGDKAALERTLAHSFARLDEEEARWSNEPHRRGRLMFVRSMLHLMRGEAKAARTASDAALRSPDPEPMYFATPLFLAIENDQPEELLKTLERAATVVGLREDQALPLAPLIKTEAVYWALRKLHAAGNSSARHRISEAILTLGWNASEDSEETNGMRVIAAQGRIKAGDTKGAAALVDQISDPAALLDLMMDKHFELLSASEKDSSETLARAILARDRITRENAVRADSGWNATAQRLRYLRAVGRNDEAIAYGLEKIGNFEDVEKGGIDAFWSVNDVAALLTGSNRFQEAEKLLDKLLALDIERHPDLINMRINQLKFFLSAGWAERVLERAGTLDGPGNRYASDYGLMWVRAHAVCAANDLNRMDDTRYWLNKTHEQASENPDAAIKAQLCVEDYEAAEKVLIAALEEPEDNRVLRSLQNYTLARPANDRDIEMERRVAKLRDRPAVQEAIAKAGRVLTVPLSRSAFAVF